MLCLPQSSAEEEEEEAGSRCVYVSVAGHRLAVSDVWGGGSSPPGSLRQTSSRQQTPRRTNGSQRPAESEAAATCSWLTGWEPSSLCTFWLADPCFLKGVLGGNQLIRFVLCAPKRVWTKQEHANGPHLRGKHHVLDMDWFRRFGYCSRYMRISSIRYLLVFVVSDTKTHGYNIYWMS